MGLAWDPIADTIKMHLAVNMSLKKANFSDQLTSMPQTKRIGVSQIISIYNPLGLMAPLTICYKLVLQKITDLSMGWDDVLKGEIEKDLRKILVEMVNVTDIEFPRAVVPA